MNRPSPREIAVRVLQRRERMEGYTEDIFAQEPALAQLSPADRGLAQELTYGVVRWQATLDWLVTQKTGGRTQKVQLQILLRLGLYQVFWLERIPDHAIVHESVALAKQLGFGPQAGFVNAVLRGYIRERDATRQKLHQLRTEQPALGYSHPEWLVQRWSTRWGPEATDRLLQWNNQPPGTFARVNALRTDTVRLLDAWKREGVVVEPVPLDFAPAGLVFQLISHPRLTELRSFQEGLFYVQDPSTLLAVHELDPRPGEQILDLCAAPGGKTTYIAQRMGDQGDVLAQDRDPKRLELLSENCARLGVTSVKLAAPGDAAPGASRPLFDRVLLDAPCSNTGVMRRRVDLRWRIRPEEISRLQHAQRNLLHEAAQQIKPGGTLVYSTCSLEPEENAEVVRSFLSQHPGFALVRERELLPFVEGQDGAYVARLSKN